MYYIFAAFVSGVLAGWLISIVHIRSLKQHIEVCEHFVHSRIETHSRKMLLLEIQGAPAWRNC
jgi:hypothetical protein